jgi:hypothetical protein
MASAFGSRNPDWLDVTRTGKAPLRGIAGGRCSAPAAPFGCDARRASDPGAKRGACAGCDRTSTSISVT